MIRAHRLSHRRTFSWHAAYVLAVRCIGAGALFGYEIVLSRMLGVTGYGTFGFVLAAAVLVSRLAPLGWLNASTQLCSRYIAECRPELLRGSLICAYATATIGVFAATPLFLAAKIAVDTGGSRPIYFVALLLGVILTFLEVNRFVLRGLHAAEVGEAISVLGLPAMASVLMLLFWINSPMGAIYVYGAAALFMVIGSTLYVVKTLPTAVFKVSAVFYWRRWSVGALAMLVGSLSDELGIRTALIILGTLGSEDEVGFYQAATRVALMNVFVLRAITPVAAPRISRVYHTGEMPELRSLYKRMCIISTAGCLPFCGICILFPEVVLRLFGSGFEQASLSLRLLSLGYLMSAISGPCATALMMIGKERTYSIIAAAGFMINIVLTTSLVSVSGAVGASIATALSITFVNIGCLMAVVSALRGSGHRRAS